MRIAQHQNHPFNQNESMNDKVPCEGCQALILPSTAERTGGFCMPCKSGYRKNIEQAKEHYKKERELEKTCLYRALWRELYDKVFNKLEGFDGLTKEEKTYYSVNILSSEVYNGGFVQYFDNTSGSEYKFAEHGLIQLGAQNSLKLLREAKNILFGLNTIPKDQEQRWKLMRSHNQEPNLDALDTEFYQDSDELDNKLESYAIKFELIQNTHNK